MADQNTEASLFAPLSAHLPNLGAVVQEAKTTTGAAVNNAKVAASAAVDDVKAAVDNAQGAGKALVDDAQRKTTSALHEAKQQAFGSPTPHAPASATDDIVTPSKTLDFGSVATEQGTPVTPVLPAKTTAVPATLGSEEVDYDLFIKETLLWSNKIRSAFYFVLGLVLWAVVRAIFSSSITLPTGIAYVLLASLAFNFLRAVMAPRIAERVRWSGSSWTRFASSTATATIDAVASIYDRHLNGLDPLHTLEVALLLWLVSLLGRALDAVSLLLLLHLAAFTLPAAYSRFKTKVDTVVGDVYSQAKAKYDSLSRVVKASAILGTLVVLAVVLPPLDRAVALNIILVYGRAILKPTEYASIAKKVEVVASAFKGIGDKATDLAVTTINKYELSPTPLRTKRKQL